MDNKKLKKVIKDYYNKKENITLSDENIRIFFNNEEKHKIFII